MGTNGDFPNRGPHAAAATHGGGWPRGVSPTTVNHAREAAADQREGELDVREESLRARARALGRSHRCAGLMLRR
jgi:hypothetical protein